MEHPEVAYRLAVERQLELERAVTASRHPASGRFSAILGAIAARLARRLASLFDQLHARRVPDRRSKADSPLFD
jgi:hypothetical protein